jgi:hypothetical protein
VSRAALVVWWVGLAGLVVASFWVPLVVVVVSTRAEGFWETVAARTYVALGYSTAWIAVGLAVVLWSAWRGDR